MPDAEPTNPYAPPEAVPPPRPRRSPLGVGAVVRVVAVVVGFSLLADPAAVPPVGALARLVPHGRTIARTFGLVGLLVAFLPWRVGVRPDRPPEDL